MPMPGPARMPVQNGEVRIREIKNIKKRKVLINWLSKRKRRNNRKFLKISLLHSIIFHFNEL